MIAKHNAEMKIISDTARVTGISRAALFYAAHFGIIGMPWVITEKQPKGTISATISPNGVQDKG